MNLNEIKHLILDMDGVLWHGETPLPELRQFFDQLEALGIKHVFATNNGTKTRDMYVTKFERFGVSIREDQVMTSAIATASYLSSEYEPSETPIYVIGKVGLISALKAAGFPVLERYDAETPAKLVTVAFNPEVTYEDFACGTIQIRQHGARLIGSNPDTTFPSERGLVPGAGSLIAFMAAATDQTPTIIGKPYPTMFREAMKMLGTDATPANTAMVGDRLNTDMAGAFAAGIGSMLVLSGVSQPHEVEAAERKPDFVFKDIHELVAALENA